MTVDNHNYKTAGERLRHDSEERLRSIKAKPAKPCSGKDLLKLVHELEVHQIELEMQNEELCNIRHELETVLEKYTNLYDFAPVGYLALNRNGVINSVNLCGAGLLERECSRLLNRNFESFVTKGYRSVFRAFLDKVFENRTKDVCEVHLVNKLRPMIVHIEAITDAAGIECRLALVDITGRRQAEARVNEVLRQQQTILDNIPNPAWLKDRGGKYVAVNDSFGMSLGMIPNELTGKTDFDIYPQELAEKYDINTKGVIRNGRRTYFEELTLDWNGNEQYLEKIETPVFNDLGDVIGVIGIANDVTNRKEVELTLRHDSTHDVLTGLYNRLYFDEELNRLSRGRLFPVSIVMADINDLKSVNDTLGHEAGDRLICLAAGILMRAFRADDTVARIGGDEFAVLMPGTSFSVAEEVVARILNSPEITDGQVSIAFGIASAENSIQLGSALKRSDENMYQHKSDQKIMKTVDGEFVHGIVED